LPTEIAAAAFIALTVSTRALRCQVLRPFIHSS
jgi:hypothetical protein